MRIKKRTNAHRVDRTCVILIYSPHESIWYTERPYRDRTIIEVYLACGVRHEELVNLDLDQVVIGAADPTRGDRAPIAPAALRKACKVQLVNVRGKNQTLRNLFLSADARAALADYLELERCVDAEGLDQPRALFLRAGSIQYAKKDDSAGSVVDEGDANGRLMVRSINKLVTKIGELHDAEQEGERKIGGPAPPYVTPHLWLPPGRRDEQR